MAQLLSELKLFSIFSQFSNDVMKNKRTKKYVCEFDMVPGHYELGKVFIITAIKPSQQKDYEQGTEEACDLAQRSAKRDGASQKYVNTKLCMQICQKRLRLFSVHFIRLYAKIKRYKRY